MIRRRTSPRSAVLALLAAAMMLLAACGGGDETPEPDTDDTGVTDTDDNDADTGGGLATLTDADCRQYAQAFEDVPTLADPDSLDSIGQLADVLDEAAENVPNEISDDFQVLASAYREFSDALGDLEVDFDDPAALAALGPEDFEALEAAGQAFETGEVEEATGNIETFLRENCL